MAKKIVNTKKAKSNRAERITLHKYIVLSQCMMETLDEMGIKNPAFEAALEEAERILDLSIGSNTDPIKTTMYIEEIVQKINTIMRKNYEPH